MLPKLAEQVADDGSQRFRGVTAALESRRPNFRKARVAEDMNTAIAYQLCAGTKRDAKLIPGDVAA